MEKTEKKKNQMLNFIKGIACIGVVFIHVTFPGMAGEIISKLAQFAVPVFFMIAGYYAFGCQVETIRRRLFKIIKIFIFSYLCFFCYSAIFQAKNALLITWLKSLCTWKACIKFVVFCNIDFAVPLWYLIAMIETYFVWYIAVKKKKEESMLNFIPVLFLAQIVIITFCETSEFAWFWKTNFLTRAMPWFLTGYWIHEQEKTCRQKMGILNNNVNCGLLVLFGGCSALIPLIFHTKVQFSCVGLIPYAIGIFSLGVNNPSVSLNKQIEYIGDKLSLNVYIFHVLIGGAIGIVWNHIQTTPCADKVFAWMRPIITVVLAVLWAYLLEKGKVVLKKRRVRG